MGRGRAGSKGRLPLLVDGRDAFLRDRAETAIAQPQVSGLVYPLIEHPRALSMPPDGWAPARFLVMMINDSPAGRELGRDKVATYAYFVSDPETLVRTALECARDHRAIRAVYDLYPEGTWPSVVGPLRIDLAVSSRALVRPYAGRDPVSGSAQLLKRGADVARRYSSRQFSLNTNAIHWPTRFVAIIVDRNGDDRSGVVLPAVERNHSHESLIRRFTDDLVADYFGLAGVFDLADPKGPREMPRLFTVTLRSQKLDHVYASASETSSPPAVPAPFWRPTSGTRSG